MVYLKEQDVQFIPISVDSLGRIFFYDNRVFRAIYPASVNRIKEFLNSDLYKELLEKNMIVSSVIVDDIDLENYPVIIEHDKLFLVSRPSEWTFSMLKDAAFLYLDAYSMAKKHGYHLIDGHPSNISFKGVKPIFLDIGSFMSATGNNERNVLSEFITSIYLPLKLMSKGSFFMAYLLLEGKFPGLYFPVINLENDPVVKCDDFVVKGFKKRLRRKVLTLLSRYPSLEEDIRTKINGLSFPVVRSSWDNYHDDLISFSNKNKKAYDRFDKIIDEIIKMKDINSCLDLAGNQGLMSLMLAEKTSIKNIFSSDCDLNAINKLSLFLKDQDDKYPQIEPLVLNLILPQERSQLVKTVKVDLVLAMAVTHHLILHNNYHIDTVLSIIKSYTKSYAIIEFMPFGLWDGISERPKLPDWYTQKWFEEAFKKHFSLINTFQADHRVVYVGKIKGVF